MRLLFGPRGRIFGRFHEDKQRLLKHGIPIYDAVVQSNLTARVPSRHSHVGSRRDVADLMGRGFPSIACQITDRAAALELADFAKHLQKPIKKKAQDLVRPIEAMLPRGSKFEIEVTHPERAASLSYRLIRDEFLGAGYNGVVFKTMNERGQVYAMKIPLVRYSSVGTGWSVLNEAANMTPEELRKADAQGSCDFVERLETKIVRFLGAELSPEVVYERMHLLIPVMTGRIKGLNMVTPLADDRALTNVAILLPYALADLAQVMSGGEPPEHVKMEITRQMIASVARLHSVGLAHLDIKPGNFVVDANGNVILADMADVEPIPRFFAPTLKAGIEGPGTPAFLPPERTTDDGPPAPEGDAWSLGVSLHQLWFGFLPYDLGTLVRNKDPVLATESLQNIALTQPDFSLPAGFQVPPEIAGILKGLLQTDPSRRLTPLEIVKNSPLFAFSRRKV